jgi:hypothetical protein
MLLTSGPSAMRLLLDTRWRWVDAMKDVKAIDDFYGKAKSIRAIAKGIYDDKEREFLLRFVKYCEKMAVEKLKRP